MTNVQKPQHNVPRSADRKPRRAKRKVGRRSASERRQFDAAVLQHIDELFGTAVRLTRSPADAEDLVQEAIMRAWTFWDRFEQGTNGRAWMHRILMNTFINGYRKKRREREIMGELRRQPVRTPRIGLASPDLGDEVEAALASLPEEFRAVVLMIDAGDLSYREAAEAIGCPIGTVMSRLHRGRKLLQARLSDYAQAAGVLRAA